MTSIRLGVFERDSTLVAQAQAVAQTLDDGTTLETEIVRLEAAEHVLDSQGEGRFDEQSERARIHIETFRNRLVDVLVMRASDLPLDLPEDLMASAFLPRTNPLTWLAARSGLIAASPSNPIGLPSGSIVAAPTMVIARQLMARRPGLQVLPTTTSFDDDLLRVRGGEIDAIVSPAFPIRRHDGIDVRWLSSDTILPAAGEGVVALLTRSDDSTTGHITRLDDALTARAVSTERLLLGMLDPITRAATACLATVSEDGGIRLLVVVASAHPDSHEVELTRVGSFASDPETAASTCRHALAAAHPDVFC